MTKVNKNKIFLNFTHSIYDIDNKINNMEGGMND